ncbi:phosphoribosyltransferase [Thalassobaculum fulvum]|uniref:Phosphoribosyltransferase n=1 Tax=Thalassobaculum fulvum TaxID=1633335 RepID=A0A919CNE7_9PROT|nr:phosphoribosyltransferase [Thalassobaculum fulvum]GHD44716.1 phosphoribosyltransferase [Thalassobaculum fulvum]
MIFADRFDAGRRLAEALQHLADRDPVVLALVRGGLPVAFEVAKALAAPLDVVLVRKIGAPSQPELAVGAVVDGAQPEIVSNPEIMAMLGLSQSYVEAEAKRQLAEIDRRRAAYLRGRPPVEVHGRTAIVVDDGIATGATTRAALHAVRRRQPSRLVLAVPVAPPDTLERLAADADEIVCLDRPEPFGAVGYFYNDFTQVSDREVVDLLDRARAGSDPEAP